MAHRQAADFFEVPDMKRSITLQICDFMFKVADEAVCYFLEAALAHELGRLWRQAW